MKKIYKISEYKNNILNIFIITIIIILGLISREISIIPYFVGDILRGMMIFFIIKLFINKNMLTIGIISLIICFSIEFSQLLEYALLTDIRNTQIGATILGTGFLVSDLVAYCIGVGLSGLFMRYYKKGQNK